MTTRVHRLWTPGSAQRRVFLPNYWMLLVDDTKNKIRPNVIKFQVSMEMTRYDVREYLDKVYGVPVRGVSTVIVEGATQMSMLDRRARHAMERDPSKKYAFVTLPRTVNFKFPELYKVDTELYEKKSDDIQTDLNKRLEKTEKESERGPLREWFGV